MMRDDDADNLSSASHADVVIFADGEVDMATAPPLSDAVTAALVGLVEGTRIVFDLGAVTFMDSAGLKAIALACQHAPGRVVVRNAAGQVRRLLDISGVGRFVGLEV